MWFLLQFWVKHISFWSLRPLAQSLTSDYGLLFTELNSGTESMLPWSYLVGFPIVTRYPEVQAERKFEELKGLLLERAGSILVKASVCVLYLT